MPQAARQDRDGQDIEKPVFDLPDGFDSEEDFLRHIREKLDEDLLFDKENIDNGLSDSEFVAGYQWDDTVRAIREASGKPTLTVNRLPAFVMTVIGQRRLNQTTIKVAPDTGGNKKVARVREDLIRNIQKVSDADRVYSEALENVIISGQANFEVELDYAQYDVFEQDIGLKSYPNPFAVIWDASSTDPTGKDARRCFVLDEEDEDDFKSEYPWATAGDMAGLTTPEYNDAAARGWYQSNQVRVVAYWQMGEEDRTVALMLNGQVEDVTDKELEDYIDEVAVNQKTGEPFLRETKRPYAERYLVTGTDILEGPYRLPLNRLPIIRVSGWVINVGKKRERVTFFRFAKDSQRLHNYWRSVLAEKLMASPKATWIAPDTAVEGYEDDYETAHVSDKRLLKYNAETAIPPKLVPPPQIDSAILNEAGIAAQDIKDITNIQEASLGQTSNEVSGKAIIARQRIGELSTAIPQANLDAAIAEAGDVINQLIPITYDTPRVIKVLGADDKARMEAINGYEDSTLDITSGKYALTIVTGPSTITKRAEAAESMLNMVNAMPQAMAVVADLIVEAQDWPGAEEISRRLKMQMPKGVISEEDLTDEQKQQRQEAAAQEKQVRDREEAALALELTKMQADVELMKSRANLANADAQVKLAKLEAEVETEESVAILNEAKAKAAEIGTQIEVLEKFGGDLTAIKQGLTGGDTNG